MHLKRNKLGLTKARHPHLPAAHLEKRNGEFEPKNYGERMHSSLSSHLFPWPNKVDESVHETVQAAGIHPLTLLARSQKLPPALHS